MKSLVQRNVCREFLQLNSRALTSFSIILKLWLWLSEINVRCKQEQSTGYTEEVKWLHESCIVFRCTEFNQLDFDKPIMFVSLTIAHIKISSLPFVCLTSRKYYSIFLFYTWQIGIYNQFPSHLFPPLSLCPSLSAAWLPHITDFDSMWMRTLRETLAPYWEFFCKTPGGHFSLTQPDQ